jgi:hypothetical protein
MLVGVSCVDDFREEVNNTLLRLYHAIYDRSTHRVIRQTSNHIIAHYITSFEFSLRVTNSDQEHANSLLQQLGEIVQSLPLSYGLQITMMLNIIECNSQQGKLNYAVLISFLKVFYHEPSENSTLGTMLIDLREDQYIEHMLKTILKTMLSYNSQRLPYVRHLMQCRCSESMRMPQDDDERRCLRGLREVGNRFYHIIKLIYEADIITKEQAIAIYLHVIPVPMRGVEEFKCFLPIEYSTLQNLHTYCSKDLQREIISSASPETKEKILNEEVCEELDTTRIAEVFSAMPNDKQTITSIFTYIPRKAWSVAANNLPVLDKYFVKSIRYTFLPIACTMFAASCIILIAATIFDYLPNMFNPTRWIKSILNFANTWYGTSILSLVIFVTCVLSISKIYALMLSSKHKEKKVEEETLITEETRETTQQAETPRSTTPMHSIS